MESIEAKGTEMTNEDFMDAIYWLENEGIEDAAALGRWNIEERLQASFPGGISAFVAENEQMRGAAA
jgi:hypothetical protein